MEPKYVKIEINDLAYLISRAYELYALEKGGVDNWEGIAKAFLNTLMIKWTIIDTFLKIMKK